MERGDVDRVLDGDLDALSKPSCSIGCSPAASNASSCRNPEGRSLAVLSDRFIAQGLQLPHQCAVILV